MVMSARAARDANISHLVQAYYAKDVEPPRKPGELMMGVWFKDRTGSMARTEIDIFKGRKAVGCIELYTLGDDHGHPAWTVTIEQAGVSIA